MHFSEKDLAVDIANMMFDVTENLVDIYHGDGDFEGFDFDLIRSFSMDSPVRDQEFKKVKRNTKLLKKSIPRFLIHIKEKLKQYQHRLILF